MGEYLIAIMLSLIVLTLLGIWRALDRISDNLWKISERLDRISDNLWKISERLDRISDNLWKISERKK